MQLVAERQQPHLADLLQAWEASHQQVITAVRALSDADYDLNGPVAQVLEDTIDGALGNNTYDHYAEHLPEIEAWIRGQV